MGHAGEFGISHVDWSADGKDRPKWEIGSTTQVPASEEPMKVTIVTMDKQFAVFLNDLWTLYGVDPYYVSAKQPALGYLPFGSGLPDDCDSVWSEARFDNLYVWDISDLAIGSQ